MLKIQRKFHKKYSCFFPIVLLLQAIVFTAWGIDKTSIQRSDGKVLHVDFENYIDRVIGPLNAGIRFLGNPFENINQGKIEVVNDATTAFTGKRCGYIFTERLDQKGQILFQRRYNAPSIKDTTVTEFVFRPVKEKPRDIENLTVWSEFVYQPSCDKETNMKDLDVWAINSYTNLPGGITLLANGLPNDGIYSLDVQDKTGLIKEAVKGLKQTEWVRIVMLRKRAEQKVDLWVGPVDQEKFIGTYIDFNSEGEFRQAKIGDLSQKENRGSGYWDDIRIGAILGKNGKVAPAEVMRDVGKEAVKIEYPIEVGKKKQLFMDDVVIQSMKGLERKLNPAQKHPKNPLIIADQSWEGDSVLLYGSVIKDPDTNKFRMWYLSFGKHIKKSSYICYAESYDGITWVKPKLGIMEVEGSKNNNCVMQGHSDVSILYDPLDVDPNRRYKAMNRIGGHRAYFSKDGLNWQKAGIMIEQGYDCSHVHWNPVDRMWNAEIKISCAGRRAQGYAESKDFQNWSDTYLMLTVDEKDELKDHIYGMCSSWYETLFIGLLRIYNTGTDKVDIELATSRNGRYWDRLFRDPFIPTGEEGSWDFGNNASTSAPPIQVGNELWIYYSGRKNTHQVKPNFGAIGLATMRVDGFVSVNADKKEGIMLTKPILLKGNSLFVNADAKDGEIRVEILDANSTFENMDMPIVPYSKDKCHVVSKDNVRQSITWDGNSGLSEKFRAKPVRLKFYIKNAKLYAFWME